MIDPGATASDGSLAAAFNVFPGHHLNSVMSGHKKGLAVPDHYRFGPRRVLSCLSSGIAIIYLPSRRVEYFLDLR